MHIQLFVHGVEWNVVFGSNYIKYYIWRSRETQHTRRRNLVVVLVGPLGNALEGQGQGIAEIGFTYEPLFLFK